MQHPRRSSHWCRRSTPVAQSTCRSTPRSMTRSGPWCRRSARRPDVCATSRSSSGWDARTAQSSRPCVRRRSRSRSWGSQDSSPSPRSSTSCRSSRSSRTSRPIPRCCGCSPGPVGASARVTWRCWAVAPRGSAVALRAATTSRLSTKSSPAPSRAPIRPRSCRSRMRLTIRATCPTPRRRANASREIAHLVTSVRAHVSDPLHRPGAPGRAGARSRHRARGRRCRRSVPTTSRFCSRPWPSYAGTDRYASLSGLRRLSGRRGVLQRGHGGLHAVRGRVGQAPRRSTSPKGWSGRPSSYPWCRARSFRRPAVAAGWIDQRADIARRPSW